MFQRIRLTEAGQAEIQRWADEHHMSFSAAVETLCKLGMGQAVEEALAPAVVSVSRREMQKSQTISEPATREAWAAAAQERRSAAARQAAGPLLAANRSSGQRAGWPDSCCD